MKLVNTFPIHARWGDNDSNGHVNNAKYLTYFESARINWLRSSGILVSDNGMSVVMVTANIVFRRPIVAPTDLIVQTYLVDIGRSSLVTKQDLLLNDNLMSEVEVKLVFIDSKTQKSVALPDHLRQLIVAQISE